MNKKVIVIALSSCTFVSVNMFGSGEKAVDKKTTNTILKRASTPMKLSSSKSANNKDSCGKDQKQDSLAAAPSAPKQNTVNNADVFNEKEYDKYFFICPCSKWVGKRNKIPARQCYKYDKEECVRFCNISLTSCCAAMIYSRFLPKQ